MPHAIADDLLARDKALRDLLVRLQNSQARRNEASKLIGQAKQKKDEAQAKALMAEVAGLKDAIQQGEAEQRELEKALRDALAVIPNLPADDVPDGADENANVPVAARAFGKPPGHQQSQAAFRDRRGAGPDGFRARRQGVGRAVCLSERRSGAAGTGAWRAFMLDTHTQQFGYTEVSPPVLVRDKRCLAPASCRNSRTIFSELGKIGTKLRWIANRSIEIEAQRDVQRSDADRGIRCQSASGSSPPPKCR